MIVPVTFEGPLLAAAGAPTAATDGLGTAMAALGDAAGLTDTAGLVLGLADTAGALVGTDDAIGAVVGAAGALVGAAGVAD